MKKKRIYNFLGSVSILLAVLLMFCIAGGLDTDKLTIKSAVILALIDFNFFGLSMYFNTKGGQAYGN